MSDRPASDHVDHLLEQWARERPDLDTRPLAIAARVVRLERFLSRASRAALDELGVNEGEGNVLAALRRAGPPYRLTPTELYQSLLLSSGAMTNRIDRLEAQGYVVREGDPNDRRRTFVRLTADGRALVDRAIDAHSAALAEVLAPLDDRSHGDLERLLRDLLAAIEHDA